MSARDRDAKLPKGYAMIEEHSMGELTKSCLLNNFARWNHYTCGIQTQIIEESLTKLKFHKIEMATGSQMRAELISRKVAPDCINRFLLEWGCRPVTAQGDHAMNMDPLSHSITDTATELREEV